MINYIKQVNESMFIYVLKDTKRESSGLFLNRFHATPKKFIGRGILVIICGGKNAVQFRVQSSLQS